MKPFIGRTRELAELEATARLPGAKFKHGILFIVTEIKFSRSELTTVVVAHPKPELPSVVMELHLDHRAVRVLIRVPQGFRCDPEHIYAGAAHTQGVPAWQGSRRSIYFKYI